MMEFTAEMIAGFLGGDIVGDKEAKVHTVSSIEEGKAGSLTYLTNPKYETFLYSTGASIVLVNRSFEPSQQVSATLIKVDDAAACVLKLLEMYNAAKPRVQWIVDTAKARNAKGVLVALTKFCDPEEFDYVMIKKACEAAGIPVTVVEIDRQMVQFEQARTNIETFRDMLTM